MVVSSARFDQGLSYGDFLACGAQKLGLVEISSM
jgi:hypothetical protein